MLSLLCWCQSQQGMSEVSVKPPLKKRKGKSQKELLDKIDLTGLRDWSLDEQKEAQELITKYTSTICYE